MDLDFSKKREDRKMTELLPIATFEGDSFRMQDGNYLDMVQVITRDLIHMSIEALQMENLRFQNFYKTYTDDVKLVALNFPKNTKVQQKYFEKKIKNEKNPLYRQELTDQLEYLKWLEKNKTEREYYLFFWAKNTEDLKNKQMRIYHNLLDTDPLIRKMTPEKKQQVIYSINNKCAKVFI